MGNRWHEWVRKYAKENNISYMCAISEAKKTYIKESKDEKKEKMKKEKMEMLQRMDNMAIRSFYKSIKELSKDLENKILFQKVVKRWLAMKQDLRKQFLEKYPKKENFLNSMEKYKSKLYKITAKEYIDMLKNKN